MRLVCHASILTNRGCDPCKWRSPLMLRFFFIKNTPHKRKTFFLAFLILKMGPIACSKTLVRNYDYMLRNIPALRRYSLHRDESPQSRKDIWKHSVRIDPHDKWFAMKSFHGCGGCDVTEICTLPKFNFPASFPYKYCVCDSVCVCVYRNVWILV